MMPEHKLLLAVSAILKTSYPHLEEMHAAVEKRAAEYAEQERADVRNDPVPESVDHKNDGAKENPAEPVSGGAAGLSHHTED